MKAIKPNLAEKGGSKTRNLLQALKEDSDFKDEIGDADEGDSSASESGGLIMSPEALASEAALQRTMSIRAPEFFLKEGGTARVYFRQSSPIAGFYAYNVQGTGGRWNKLIVNRDNDVLAEHMDRGASLYFVWELIDLTGYIDKKQKAVKDIPRFFVVSGKVNDQLSGMAASLIADGEKPLHKRPCKVIKTGSGKDSTYSFIPLESKPLTDEQLRIPRLKPEDYYKALSRKEQLNWLRAHRVS